jgi:hypothetical protein
LFSNHGVVYTAPTLICHDVAVHHYLPPDEFLRAVDEGPCPPDPGYFDRLVQAGLDSNKTSTPAEEPDRFIAIREDGKIVRKKV